MKTVLVQCLHGNDRHCTVIGYKVKGRKADEQEPNHPGREGKKEREREGMETTVEIVTVEHTLSIQPLLESRLVRLTVQQGSLASPALERYQCTSVQIEI